MQYLQASEEQQNIIEMIGENNLVVDSVAGSGKTTTNQFIAMNYPEKKILLLTYNKRLKDETKKKFQSHGINNTTIHTFHSFCYNYYMKQAIKDKQILQILNDKWDSNIPYRFDIIIVDEAQDLTPTYFRLVLKICNENSAGKNFTLCIMGDQKQCINEYLKADSRFIQMADRLFSGVNKYPWKIANLSTTFRLTQQMCQFINVNVLSQQRLVSRKSGCAKPRYLICDAYQKYEKKKNFQFILKMAKEEIKKNDGQNGNYDLDKILKLIESTQREYQNVVLEVFYYLVLGYKFEDIFIIAPSLKINTPASIIANDLSYHKIPILLLNSEDKSNDLLFKNKIVFLSYNKAKGLERKVSIVLGFDESYNEYYNKNNNTGICSNAHYVAITRASEQLTIVQNKTKRSLSFLKFDDQQKRENIEKIGENSFYQNHLQIKDLSYQKIVTPKNLIMHIPQEIESAALKYLKYVPIKGKGEIIQAPTISEQKFKSFNFKQQELLEIYEQVEDINETAIHIFFDICDNKSCFVFNQIKSIQNQNDQYLSQQSINRKVQEKFNKIEENYKQFFTNLQLNELLFMSNYWNCVKNKQSFKLNQIQNYDWMEIKTLQSALNRIYEVIDQQQKCNVSEFLQFNQSDQLQTKNLVIQSFISFVQERNVWDIKFAEELKDSHQIYFSIQKYLYLMSYKMSEIDKLNTMIEQCELQLIENPSVFYIKNSPVFYLKQLKNRKSVIKECTFLNFSLDQKRVIILTKKNKKKAIERDNLIHPDYFKLTQQLWQVTQDQYYNFRLLNVYDGEIYEEKTSLEDLQKMVDLLIDYKYGKGHKFESNQQFLDTMESYKKQLNV